MARLSVCSKGIVSLKMATKNRTSRATLFLLLIAFFLSAPALCAQDRSRLSTIPRVDVHAHLGGDTQLMEGYLKIGKILKEGDWQLNLANNCLETLFEAGGDSETSQLLQILSLTDFDLKKVTIKELKQDPTRVRFGFEFNKRDALKTVYWEADCPINGPDEELKQQTTAAR